MSNEQAVSNFKKIERLEVLGYSPENNIQQVIRLPKTLKHLALKRIDFENMEFSLDLNQLTSLELNNLDLVTNDVLTYVSKNCLGLQYFKIECEYLLKFFKLVLYYYYRYIFKLKMFKQLGFIELSMKVSLHWLNCRNWKCYRLYAITISMMMFSNTLLH